MCPETSFDSLLLVLARQACAQRARQPTRVSGAQCPTVNVLPSLQRPDHTERMVDASGIQRGKLEMVRVAFTKTSSVSRAFCLVVLNGHSSWEIKKD